LISSTQPASNDLPSNELFHPVNPPAASDFISVDSTNNSFTTNPELPTCPTPIDCCVPVSLPSVFFQPESSTNTDQPTPIDCCVALPDSPDFKLPVNVCHEYIKRKVLQHGIGQELLTSNFYDCIEQLQRVIETAAKAMEENESLTVLFLDAAKTSSLDEKWKRKIMSALILKVLHARSAAEHDKYKEQHTNREAKGATASSFRGELKVLTKGAHNNNKVKRRKMK
jgi:hypothetical protein